MSFYVMLLDLGLSFLEQFLANLVKSDAPKELIEAFKAAFNALLAHKNDTVTKANLEAQRG